MARPSCRADGWRSAAPGRNASDGDAGRDVEADLSGDRQRLQARPCGWSRRPATLAPRPTRDRRFRRSRRHNRRPRTPEPITLVGAVDRPRPSAPAVVAPISRPNFVDAAGIEPPAGSAGACGAGVTGARCIAPPFASAMIMPMPAETSQNQRAAPATGACAAAPPMPATKPTARPKSPNTQSSHIIPRAGRIVRRGADCGRNFAAESTRISPLIPGAPNARDPASRAIATGFHVEIWIAGSARLRASGWRAARGMTLTRHFKFPQKRWMRRQASSRSSVLVA